MPSSYSSTKEARSILDQLLDLYSNDDISLPLKIRELKENVRFTANRDFPYFPTPFKETETGAALKGIEGLLAAALADLRQGRQQGHRGVKIDLEKTTAFLFQAYLATVGGLGKLDPEVKTMLKGMMH